MIPAVDVIKIIAFEAEPVIDRVHYTYTLVFTVDKNNVRWKVTHQFSRFKILNLLIRKLAPKLIYSKFPKDSTTTLLGLRVSKKAVDNRRLMLDMWIREVVANFEIFPEEIAQSLTDFIKAPKKVTTLLEKSFSSNSDENPSNFFSATVGTVVGRGSSSNHIIAGSTHDGKKYANSQPPTAPKKKQRIELIIKSMTQLCSKIASRLNVHLNTKFQGTVTVCISRTEKVVTINRINSPGIFLGELLQHLTCYGQIYVIITVLNNVIWSLLFVWVDISCSSAVVLLLASFAMYFQLVKSDYAEDNEITAYTPSHLTVQNTLRKFLNSPHLEYSDKIYSFPCFLAYSGHNSHGSKSDSDDESFSSDDLADIMSEEESPHQNHNKSLTKSLASPLSLGHSAGSKFWTQPEESRNPSGSNLMVNVIEKCEPPLLHESLVPGSTYDNVEFNDLCAEARAMFSDRSETHTMKVTDYLFCDEIRSLFFL